MPVARPRHRHFRVCGWPRPRVRPAPRFFVPVLASFRFSLRAFRRALRSPAALAVALLAAPALAGALTVESPKIEYMTQPLGIETTQPRFSWTLASTERAQEQSAYEIQVASSRERLESGASDVWASGRVASAETFGLGYNGPPLASGDRYHWRVRVWDGRDRVSDWSDPAWWQMGLLHESDRQARWIAAADDETSPRLRREFSIAQPVVQATAYAYAVGWYELRLNGQKVGDRVLTPVNSNYSKGLFYDVYDVTEQIRSRDNAVGIWLGGGYNQNYSKYGYRWAQPPAAWVQIELRFADGSRRVIASDERWKASASPIVANHIYDGETYDARREQEGWDRPGFADAGWTPVVEREVVAGGLKASLMPPMKITRELRPVSVTEVRPQVFVFDFGQNIAGWVRLRVAGDRGARVVLRHAENVHGDGTLDVATNRKARATDTYVLRGGGMETYEPRFTYHGFRYVEVTGFPGRPTLESVTACAVSSAVEETGTFTSSDPLLNRIQQNFLWSIRNNLMGIPTDTAVRDERTPCQMDSLAVEETAIANFDLLQYYAKWLEDIRGDGGMPPNWTGDQVVLADLLYRHYGDRRLLESHFENMEQRCAGYLRQMEAGNRWADGFGDWAPPHQSGDYETSFSEGEIVNTAFFHRVATITAETAEILGLADKAEQYRALAERLAREFNERHFNPGTFTYGSGRQVTSILPLAFGLVPEEARRDVARALHERVMGRDRGHLDTGIFGTRYLFDVLIDHGYADSAYAVLGQRTYPSFGYQIALGATTTWEQWSYRGGMQSHNHAMFAGPGSTFYSRFAGLRPAAPGYRRMVIRPVSPAGLVQVDASMRTASGWVRSAWRRHEGYAHRVILPPNTRAEVHVPAPDVAAVRESGRPAREAEGVRFLRMEADRAVFEVGSGNYVFTVAKERHE